MAAKRSPLFWLRWVVLLVVLAWFWVAPHRAWQHFLAAVDSGSVQELQQTIDTPRLQENLRIDLAAAMMNQPGAADEKTRTEATKSFLTSLVEAAASPSGIQQTVASFGYTGPAAMTGKNPPEISFHYRSPIAMEIRMHAPGSPESETGLFTFELTGSGWRLTRIRSAWLAGKQS